MDYHSDRFEDYSLMVYKDEKLISLLPANKVNRNLYSHQGLSYGGLVLSKFVKFNTVYHIFKAVLVYLESLGIDKLYYKKLPNIYLKQFNNEVDYLLFKLRATLYRKDVTSVIDTSNRIDDLSSNRKRGIKKGTKHHLEIREVDSFDSFWNEILIPNLANTHNTKPVHSVEEISLLKEKFQDNIKQYNVYYNNIIVGGATVFETENVAHVQYISANSEKQKLGTLDVLFNYLINEKYTKIAYFDFGISNENQGQQINEGLLSWKESFGARSVTHDFYEIETKSHKLLDDVFI